MRRLLALLAGLALVAALVRLVRDRRSRRAAGVAETRADELRRKLDESRALLRERDEFEGAETTVDQASAVEPTVEQRRGEVHERARAAAEEMRRPVEPDDAAQ